MSGLADLDRAHVFHPHTEQEGLLERAGQVGPAFQERLRAAVGEHPWWARCAARP